MKSIYFGVWASMLGWPVSKRAMLVVAVTVLVVNLFFMPLILRGLSLVAKYLIVPLNAIYLVFVFFIDRISDASTAEIRNRRLNRLSGIMEWFGSRFDKLSYRLKRKKRLTLSRMLLVYAGIMVLIWMPDILRNKVDETYMPYFSYVSQLYQRAEAPSLRTAQGYPPLWKARKNYGAAQASATEEAGTEPITEAAAEVWLILSKKGTGGTNVRERPSKDSKVIVSISGDVQMLYLEEAENGWLHVRLDDGKDGWVRDYLVTEVTDGKVE